jgi:ATPase subunit of ABC transporter with duplicated ATPase domains
MPPPLLLLQDISITFGAAPLLSGAVLAVVVGDRICLVGRNGSGKSTLLRIAAGMVQPDTGKRFAQPGASIQYLSQEPDLTRALNPSAIISNCRFTTATSSGQSMSGSIRRGPTRSFGNFTFRSTHRPD